MAKEQGPLHIEAVTEVLGIEPTAEEDRLLGPVAVFSMEGARLRVFLERGAIRAETGLASIDLVGVTDVSPLPSGGIHIEATGEKERTTLDLSPAGIVFQSSLVTDAPIPLVAQTEPDQVQKPERLRRSDAKEDDGERVTLTGFVRKGPFTGQTPKGTDKSVVIFAVYPPGKRTPEGHQATDWYRVVGIGQRAELIASLKPEERKEIIGYLRVKEEKGQKGMRKVNEVTVTMVREPKVRR